MKMHILTAAVATTLGILISTPSLAIMPGSLPRHWNEGAEDCAVAQQPPLQVHAYNPRTFVLRQSLCATGESNFLYLLVGDTRSLLIDTGDVADAAKMPLAETVLALMSQAGAAGHPLLVVHTHRHQDHRGGDAQFAALPRVTVVGYDLPNVQRHYGFSRWPHGVAQIELGGRIVDVVPTPGHETTHLVFYDRSTALLFSGDMLMPGRLLLEDSAADLASAQRLADWVRDRPIANVLGGHIERARSGELFASGSTHHPGERPLEMTKSDVLALPAAIEKFSGFYTQQGAFTIINPVHNLAAAATAALAVLALLIVGYLRYRRKRVRLAGSARAAASV
ncbi:MAG: MBL fold metallo-hydrolase [Sphingopyxis sp.]